MEDFFRVGVIANTHGIRGEVKVYPTTDDVKRFDYLKEVILDTKKEKITLNVASRKYFKNMVILKFKEYDNINDIEKYKGCDLLVTRENAIPLEEGEYYIADIIDAKVYLEDGSEYGVLKDVYQTGANDVYLIINNQGKEVLLPSIPDCIIERNVEDKKIVIRLMKGLAD